MDVQGIGKANISIGLLPSSSSVMTPNSSPAISAPAIEFTSPLVQREKEFDDITEQEYCSVLP